MVGIETSAHCVVTPRFYRETNVPVAAPLPQKSECSFPSMLKVKSVSKNTACVCSKIKLPDQAFFNSKSIDLDIFSRSAMSIN